MNIFQTIKNWIAPSQAQETPEEIPRAIARAPRELGVPREVARVPTKGEVLPAETSPPPVASHAPVQQIPVQQVIAGEIPSRDGDFF